MPLLCWLDVWVDASIARNRHRLTRRKGRHAPPSLWAAPWAHIHRAPGLGASSLCMRRTLGPARGPGGASGRRTLPWGQRALSSDRSQCKSPPPILRPEGTCWWWGRWGRGRASARWRPPSPTSCPGPTDPLGPSASAAAAGPALRPWECAGGVRVPVRRGGARRGAPRPFPHRPLRTQLPFSPLGPLPCRIRLEPPPSCGLPPANGRSRMIGRS